MHGPGDVANSSGRPSLAEKFLNRAHIPDNLLWIVDGDQHVFELRNRCVVQRQTDLTKFGLGAGAGFQWQPSAMPRLESSVQVTAFAVSDDIQSPDEPSGPATAFVIVNDNVEIGAIAEAAEQGR